MSATVGGGGTGAGTGGQEEDKKPMDQSAHINLKVKGQVLYHFFFLGIEFFSSGCSLFWFNFFGFMSSCNVMGCYFVVKNGVLSLC